MHASNGSHGGLPVPAEAEEHRRLANRAFAACAYGVRMIRKLPSGGYRLYSRKKNQRTGKRRNLGTFRTRAEAEKHERAVQFFKRH
jgi:hypothetical protein